MPILKLQNTSCSVSRSLSILGERWTLLILRDALEGLTRFEQFRESLGLTADVLSGRLGTLVDHGLLVRTAYQEPGRRTRHEYHLTEAGWHIHFMVASLQQWGDAHLSWPGGPTTFRRSGTTGEPLRVAFVDPRGHEVPLDQVTTVHTNGYPNTATI